MLQISRTHEVDLESNNRRKVLGGHLAAFDWEPDQRDARWFTARRRIALEFCHVVGVVVGSSMDKVLPAGITFACARVAMLGAGESIVC